MEVLFGPLAHPFIGHIGTLAHQILTVFCDARIIARELNCEIEVETGRGGQLDRDHVPHVNAGSIAMKFRLTMIKPQNEL